MPSTRLGALDGRLEIFDRLGADAVEFEHLVEVEGVEVGDVGEQAEAHESVDVLLAEVFDIEGIAPDKVLDTAADLAIAVEVHAMGAAAASSRTSRSPHTGQSVGNTQGCDDGSRRTNRADDLGDHIARAPHDHRVAWPDVLRRHLILIVECGGADGDAADEDRVEHRERGGATDGPIETSMSSKVVVCSSGGACRRSPNAALASAPSSAWRRR